jgi:phage baseplate assembly protein W|tara:strand:+ start:349 stop:816 length:468 start_codon:yes stop_codon:yes gene_type:complete
MGANSTVNYYGTGYTEGTKRYISDKLRGGKGMSFPTGINKKTGGFVSSNTGITKVKDALHQLLKTERGERVMLPKFGCNLKKFMFQPLDSKTFGQIKEEVLTSCNNYLEGATVKKLSVLKGSDVGKFGESSIHILLILQLNDEAETVFSEEIVVQ